jgi:hypothetical protein
MIQPLQSCPLKMICTRRCNLPQEEYPSAHPDGLTLSLGRNKEGRIFLCRKLLPGPKKHLPAMVPIQRKQTTAPLFVRRGFCSKRFMHKPATMVLGETEVNLVLANSTPVRIVNQSFLWFQRNTTLFSLAQRQSINLCYSTPNTKYSREPDPCLPDPRDSIHRSSFKNGAEGNFTPHVLTRLGNGGPLPYQRPSCSHHALLFSNVIVSSTVPTLSLNQVLRIVLAKRFMFRRWMSRFLVRR